ncbi:DNA mismatch repair protein MutS [Fusibacter paucivorans]|uniref:DNA mismatch repair protein MutS n=1 Tax=Fusibacter paucivorans TaxID=76009 RepID=A0ABS5PNB5_9FIRM|nr:DNA mismatch repair protein MutS [Fusibacter paucivorans]MBS7526655.1 DNA mismatch repair protein MutS [Fusibacter paucivorans]
MNHEIDRSKLTPMMKQYFEIKDQYESYLLLYRLGDFYEMFFDDALLASQALEITLTGRNCGLEERAPLCGVPYHSVEGYIKKLVDQGIKIAICEQVEDPALAKGLVKREVVRIITPGTVIDPEMLDSAKNNFVVAVSKSERSYGIAYCDITTGLFKTTTLTSVQKLTDEVLKLTPTELVVPNDDAVDVQFTQEMTHQGITVTPFDKTAFESQGAAETLKRVFKVHTVEGMGLSELPESICASGALVSYIEETAKVPLNHLTRLQVYQQSRFMILDKFTRRNLELTETMRTKEKRGALLWVLDKTGTAMGARRLKSWLEEPLIDVEAICARHDMVAALLDDMMLRSDLRVLLKQIYDFERLTSKLVYGNINPRDLIALKQSVGVLPELRLRLGDVDSEGLHQLMEAIDPLADVFQMIDDAIVEEPPITIKDGGVFNADYDQSLFELREAVTNGKQWVLDVEQREREATGIKTLKVGFNKVFGYYLEISKGSAKMAPEHYIRKQTLANAERYITPELKTIEERVLGSEEKIARLEASLFADLKAALSVHIERIQKTADAVASLDVLIAFAECSYRYGYKRPKMTDKQTLMIKNGRHPVIERIYNGSVFIPNDTLLDNRDQHFYIITGPNMAGKSTYLRQVALIALMAQIGCFVPADKAEIGVVDRIFTRVGASDDLSQGQSTFMVEMTELSNILLNTTQKSLIILDEIGRGTSTYDGLSIAWSVVEYLTKQKAKTLFATHYHELTELEGRLDGVKNFRIAVKESKDDIIFLRKIEKGGANQSFGIQVAKLAGVPDAVIQRAKEILSHLEASDINNTLSQMPAKHELSQETNVMTKALETDGYSISETLHTYLETLNADTMTPIEAMNALYEILRAYREK